MNMQSKRIKRIIYLSRQALDLRNAARFGIELFQRQGYKVEYWDATSVLHPEVYKNYQPVDSVDYAGTKVFHNMEELYRQLEILNDDTMVIDLVDFNYKFIEVYRSLSRSKADYTVIMANALPYQKKRRGTHQYFRDIFRKAKKLLMPSIWLYRVILPHLPFQWFGIKPAKFLMAGGKSSIQMYKFPVDRNTEILWAHAFDYDLYLKEISNNDCNVTSTAVFLDQFYPFNPDDLYLGIISGINYEKYFSHINLFFDMVEKELGLEVIIAAHPRSDYENRPDYFKGRRCIKGNTIRLVRESRLILLHNSTAVNYANLFNKPMIFMTFSGLTEADASTLEAIAELHGKQPVFFYSSMNIDWNQELEVNQECYQYYREEFIKTKKSAELPFWQILADKLV